MAQALLYIVQLILGAALLVCFVLAFAVGMGAGVGKTSKELLSPRQFALVLVIGSLSASVLFIIGAPPYS